MRKLGTTGLLFILSTAAAVFACSSETNTEVSAEELTDLELARAALKIMGAPETPQGAGEQASCSFTGCHSINPVTLAGWQEQFKSAAEMIASDKPNEEKINSFRQNPKDPRTGFMPERVGIIAAGAHLALSANVSATRHPETFKQGTKLAEIFAGQDELYAQFRRDVLMPVLPEYPRLTPAQYEIVLSWFQKGLPRLGDIIQEQRPTVCEDDFTRLRERTIAVKSQTWAAKNASNRMAMLGCPAPNPEQPISATECFKQQVEGKDVFPSAAAESFAATWPRDGSAVRILRDLSSPNSYWVRTSADGRFVATGGGKDAGAQAIDLKATIDGESRDIGLQASYDPDFWPDNKAFMFQGGTKFCAQSLLEKKSTELVTFSEPECSSLSAASGLYQTVGQVVADNSISDRFILYSIWAGDSGQYSASARDTPPRAGADSAVNVYTAVAEGTDVADGYRVQGAAFKIKVPYRGDTMMGRSGRLIGSRWAYGAAADGTRAAGYALETLERRVVGDHFEFDLAKVGNVCLKGNKANLSFDERFLATHHYNEPSDFTEADDPAYRTKGSADLVVVDFITGKKQIITKMGPGQFALYPHFRSDGWLYFLVVDANTDRYMIAASDWSVRQVETTPTP